MENYNHVRDNVDRVTPVGFTRPRFNWIGNPVSLEIECTYVCSFPSKSCRKATVKVYRKHVPVRKSLGCGAQENQLKLILKSVVQGKSAKRERQKVILESPRVLRAFFHVDAV